jgi:5-methylcytosine-specific restriction endonuclease McrA
MKRLCSKCRSQGVPGPDCIIEASSWARHLEQHKRTLNKARGTGMPRGWAKIRKQILERDGHRCVVCGEPAVEVDHIKPRIHGGGSDPSNLRSVCEQHNPRGRPSWSI